MKATAMGSETVPHPCYVASLGLHFPDGDDSNRSNLRYKHKYADDTFSPVLFYCKHSVSVGELQSNE